MKLLAIETSCDETAVAIVESGHTVLSSVIRSQIKNHRRYGGVVPELASRLHVEAIHALIERALEDAQLGFNDLDGIAVTHGPGLEGALLVGVSVAKTLATFLNIPLIGTHHLHGHLYAPFLEKTPPEFPYLALLVSGGHTQLIHVNGHHQFDLLGQTRDDAAGEAFDKVARLLGLGYPGGPEIQKAATSGDEKAFQFPRGMKHDGLDFSFSGLKTAVRQTVERLEAPLPVADLAASFQLAVVDVLCHKAMKAANQLQLSTIVLTGGVSANTALRTTLQAQCLQHNYQFICPDVHLSTDNAAMIGSAAYYTYQHKQHSDLSLRVAPSAPLVLPATG